jgi:hypothetical protein
MIAGVYNIFCQQGATFSRIIDLQYPDPVDPTIFHPYDLDGFTARMQVRRTVTPPATLLVELTTENGRIEIVAEDGRIILIMSAAVTAGITSSGVYDLEIVSLEGVVSRVVQGSFTLSEEVTR